MAKVLPVCPSVSTKWNSLLNQHGKLAIVLVNDLLRFVMVPTLPIKGKISCDCRMVKKIATISSTNSGLNDSINKEQYDHEKNGSGTCKRSDSFFFCGEPCSLPNGPSESNLFTSRHHHTVHGFKSLPETQGEPLNGPKNEPV